MKIGIVGAGFYGVYLSRMLQNMHEVTLYEQSDSALQRSGRINQCRLHRGYHYPRCRETLVQTSHGFVKFLNEFGDFTTIIPENIYAFRRDGKSSLDELIKNSEGISLPVIPTGGPASLKNPAEYEVFLKTDERLISLAELRHHLLATLRTTIKTGHRIVEINADTGTVVDQNGVKEQFDWIINTSFTEPNLGLPSEDHFAHSLELAAMVIMPMSAYPHGALTIMDGDFISFYPTDDGRVSLSSVPFTPFFNTNIFSEFTEAWNQRFELAKKHRVIEKIIEHGRIFLDFEPGSDPQLWIAPKARLNSFLSDGKPSRVRSHQRLITVFCGKLDSIYSAQDEIIALLKGTLE